MENVEIKETKKKVSKKKSKKVVKKAMKDEKLVIFMEDRNAKRAKVGLPAAYSIEEIESYK